MVLFSEKYNLIKKTKLQKESLENGTRNLLWNAFWELKDYLYGDHFFELAQTIWCNYLKNCSDEFPYARRSVIESFPDYSFLKNIFIEGEWYQVFDIIEIASKYGQNRFKMKINAILQRENCAYQFVNENITEIITQSEIEELEKAANTMISNIDDHLQKAIEHFSDRQNPDYRNSIKESISAVEALCRNITGASTLDGALKKLESKGVVFNSQLKKGLENIYYYTNGEDGIRHALMDADDITKADAKFMLVMCSAFINYIRVNMHS